MTSRYVLLVASGNLRREIAVGTDPLILGRGPTASIRLPDDYCSREHAKFLEREDGDLYVEDVGSRNGIFVNGERVLLDQKLLDGDKVRIGRTDISVQRTAGVPAPVRPPDTDLSDTVTKDLGPEGIQFVDPAMELGFKLTRLVAVSGMGLLFEATDAKSDMRVAFKILRPDRATEANVARVLEEAKSLASIHHPNIVRIMSTGRMKNGESFLVMSFVDGPTATQLGKSGRLWIPEALAIASETCAGLHEVHRRGMVHRDVKPSNLMVDEKTHTTVLIDFGLALTEAGGLASAPAGTIIFCAPEQVQPQSASDTMRPAVDIYGLGPAPLGGFLMISAGAMALIVRVGGGLSDRWASRGPVLVGLLTQAGVLAVLSSLPPTTSVWLVALILAVNGLSVGIMLAPFHRVVMRDISPEQAGGAAGLYSMFRFLGVAISLALCGVLLQQNIDAGLPTIEAYQHVFRVFIVFPLLGVLVGVTLREKNG